MRKHLSILVVAAAVAGLVPATAGAAITVSSNKTLNCSNGAGAPDGFNFTASNGTFKVSEDLVVNNGVTVSLVASTNTPTRCVIDVNGKATINGTIEYDQKGGNESGGALELYSSDTITISSDGKVTSNGKAGTDRTSGSPGDGTSGGPAGSVLLRAPRLISINGSVQANGGKGGNGAVVAPPSGAANGGNGGAAGTVNLLADLGTLNIGGFVSAAAGAGGGNAGSGVNGDAGANNGLIRRDALAVSGAGPITATTKRVNLPPTNLTVTNTATGGHPAFSWVDNSDEEAVFVVIRSSGGAFSAAGSVPANVHTFTDPTALQAGKTYRYLVVPVFPPTVWSNALVASNLVQFVPGGAVTSPSPGTGTVSPLAGAFSVSRSSIRSSYRLNRHRRGLSLSVRSTGTGTLSVSLRVRTRSGSRNAKRTVSVQKGTKHLTLTLPSGWRAGSYTLRLTTTSPAGAKKTVTKRISLHYS